MWMKKVRSQGFTNEATFAQNFSQEIGFLTNETLQEYPKLPNLRNGVSRKVWLVILGVYKSNFKLTFVYEFLLRLTFNSVRVMTIPKNRV
jgi:hypothetical protein